jgi:hypothetical protein
VLRVRCVGMNMWARPGASNGASTDRSAQASRTRSGTIFELKVISDRKILLNFIEGDRNMLLNFIETYTAEKNKR